MFPVGFLLQFDTKVLRYESVFIIIIIIIIKKKKCTYLLRLVICHLWYRFSIDTEVLHTGIVPKPKLWYRAIPTRDHLSSITTDNAANMKKAFQGLPCVWLGCFGHNLNLAIAKVLKIQRVD